MHFSYSEALFLLIAYLVGSIPFGLMINKIKGGEDLRKVGSKSIGATNVARVMGKKYGILTFILDASKGAVIVIMAQVIFFTLKRPEPIIALSAFLVVTGHIFPVWLKFKGGKGVATSLGVLLVIDWRVGIFACLIWLAVFYLFKVASLASIFSILLSFIFSSYYSIESVKVLCFFIALLVTIKHHQNIKRMWLGQENTFKKDIQKNL